MPDHEELPGSESSFDPEKAELETQRKKMKGDLIHDMIMVLHGMNVVETGGKNFFLSMFKIFVMLRDVMTKIITMDPDTVCPGEIPTKEPHGEFQDLWRKYAESVRDLKVIESRFENETGPRDALAVETTLLIMRCLKFAATKSLLDAITGTYNPPIPRRSEESRALMDILCDVPAVRESPVLRKDMQVMTNDLIEIGELERNACDLYDDLEALISIEPEPGVVAKSSSDRIVKTYELLRTEYFRLLFLTVPPDSRGYTVVDQMEEPLREYLRNIQRLHDNFGKQVQTLIALCQEGLSRMNNDLKRLLVSHRRKLQSDLEILRGIPTSSIQKIDKLVELLIAEVMVDQDDTRSHRESCLVLSNVDHLSNPDQENPDLDPEDGIDVHQFEWIAHERRLSKREVKQVLASFRLSIHAFSEQNELSTAMLQRMRTDGVKDQDLADYMDGCKTRMRQFREISKQMRILCREGKIGNHEFYDFFHDAISVLQRNIKQCKRYLGTKQKPAVEARERDIEEVKRTWQEMTRHPWPKDRTDRPLV